MLHDLSQQCIYRFSLPLWICWCGCVYQCSPTDSNQCSTKWWSKSKMKCRACRTIACHRTMSILLGLLLSSKQNKCTLYMGRWAHCRYRNHPITKTASESTVWCCRISKCQQCRMYTMRTLRWETWPCWWSRRCTTFPEHHGISDRFILEQQSTGIDYWQLFHNRPHNITSILFFGILSYKQPTETSTTSVHICGEDALKRWKVVFDSWTFHVQWILNMYVAWPLPSGNTQADLLSLHHFRCLHHQKYGRISWRTKLKRMIHYGMNTLIKQLRLMNAWWMNGIRLLMFSLFMLVIFISCYLHDELTA